jgi:hypothetical protein
LGKILLVEPDRITKQAIRFFLFPDHEVEVLDDIEEANAKRLENLDVLIVDASSLRDIGKLTEEFPLLIQRSKVPTIWLEDDDGMQPVIEEKLFCITKPVKSDVFRKALDRLLSRPTSQKEESSTAGGTSKRESQRKKPAKDSLDNESFIDLVEVVEEQPPRNSSKIKGKTLD